MCDSNDIQQHENEYSDFNASLQQIVRRETEGGARIIRSLLAIAEGNASACTPWHQIEAAKLLVKLGGDPDAASGSAHTKQQASAPIPAQPAEVTQGDASSPSCSSMSVPVNPEYIKVHQRLAADIRVASHDGATMVRILLEILEGYDPDARTRDKIEAAKILHDWGFKNPYQPTPEQMLRLAPCHPDCLCACKGLPEDHPEVVEAHKPLTHEQRARIAEEQAKEEERDRRTAEFIERKMRNERQHKLMEFNSPTAKDDRRIEREELRKKRQRRKERKEAYELEQKRKRIEAISRQTGLEMDFARDEELARVRARQSEADPTGPDPESDFYYEPLSPEDQALFDYWMRLETGGFEEGEIAVQPPTEASRKAYAANLERMRWVAASEGVPVLPNPLSGTLQAPTARSP